METVTSKPGIGVRHVQVVMMCLSIASLYIIRGSIGIAILAMTNANNRENIKVKTFTWDKRIQGIVLSSFFWGYMITQIPSGVIAKRFGGKSLVLGALLSNGILCLSVPLLVPLGGWRIVCLTQAGMGLWQGALFPAIHTLLGRWIPEEERTRMSNNVYTGVQLGTIISMPLSGLLARTPHSWQTIFVCMGTLGIVTAFLWWYFAASSPAQHKSISEKERAYIERSLKIHNDQKTIPWMKFLTSGPVLALTCTHIGVNWTFVIFFVETPSYMDHVLGVKLGQSAWLSTLPFLAMWFNQFICGFICEYITNRKVISLTSSRKLFNSIGCYGVSIGLIVLSFLSKEQKILAIVVLTITVGLQASCFSGFLLNHIDLSPNYAGILLGITNCVSNAVGALAPVTTGIIIGRSDKAPTRWRIVFFVAAAVISLTNVVFILFGSSDRQPWDEPHSKEEHHLLLTHKRSLTRKKRTNS